MNIQETAAVLAKIKLGDNREVDSAGLVLREWHDAIGDLEYRDAVEAVVMHRKDSISYLLPAHVRANVRLIVARRERALRASNMGRLEASRPSTFDRATFEAATAHFVEFWRERKTRE